MMEIRFHETDVAVHVNESHVETELLICMNNVMMETWMMEMDVMIAVFLNIVVMDL